MVDAEQPLERTRAAVLAVDDAGDAAVIRARGIVLSAIAAGPDVLDRTCRPGHLTGSALRDG